MEIKNCPFCGNKATTFQIPENTPKENEQHPTWEWRFPGMYVIGCWENGCMGNINNMAKIFVNEESAIEAWNRRYDG